MPGTTPVDVAFRHESLINLHAAAIGCVAAIEDFLQQRPVAGTGCWPANKCAGIVEQDVEFVGFFRYGLDQAAAALFGRQTGLQKMRFAVLFRNVIRASSSIVFIDR